MTDIRLSNGEIVWRVRCWKFEDADAARDEWARIYLAAQESDGNFSVWRTKDARDGTPYLVICGKTKAIEGIEPRGQCEEIELPQAEAEMFALRRARVGLDAEEAGKLRGPDDRVSQVARYGEGGARIGSDGGMTPA
ncbi:MAG: hypothetical protein H0U46_11875 [Actinobacteria bacterium]|nr:hypothetical protein [Actinomycetota bacterium]